MACYIVQHNKSVSGLPLVAAQIPVNSACDCGECVWDGSHWDYTPTGQLLGR